MTIGDTQAAERRNTGSITSVERACDVLGVVMAQGRQPIGVKEISDEVDLGMSTVHRILAALTNKGFVRHDGDTRKYRIGPRILDFSLNYLRNLDLREVALPYLERLRSVTRETATLSMCDGNTRVYLAQLESLQEIRQTVDLGKPMPLHLGGSGKAILAFLAESERKAHLARPDLASSVKDRGGIEALEREFAKVRERGYAFSHGERLPNAASVAAPVRGYRGQVIGCVSVSGPVWRFTAEAVPEHGGLVMQVADEISRELGRPENRPYT